MEDKNRFLQNMWKKDTKEAGFGMEDTNERILGDTSSNFRSILFQGLTLKASYMQQQTPEKIENNKFRWQKLPPSKVLFSQDLFLKTSTKKSLEVVILILTIRKTAEEN